MKPLNALMIVTTLLFLFGIEACALEVTTPSPGTPSPTPLSKVATTPALPMLEPGQSAQFPGLIVMLRRVVWEKDKLSSYWVLKNNGTRKIEYVTISEGGALRFEAQDSNGNKGSASYLPPEWDTAEQGAEKWGLVSELWPDQTAVAFEDWEFGPLSKGIQIAVTFMPEGKAYKLKWNTGR